MTASRRSPSSASLKAQSDAPARTDQETKKISASQLAEVLAAVDSRAAAADHHDRPTTPPQRDSEVSGQRAVVSAATADGVIPVPLASGAREAGAARSGDAPLAPSSSGKFAVPPRAKAVAAPARAERLKELLLFIALVVFAVLSVSLQR